MKFLRGILATFFGIGFFPLAPGTVASFFCLLLYKFFIHRLPWWLFLTLLLILFILGWLVSQQYAEEMGVKDPRRIVVDEALGQLMAFFLLSNSWFWLLMSFLLFRIFDILKPFPIKKIEKIPGGLGIMADDVIAGIYAWILVHFYFILR